MLEDYDGKSAKRELCLELIDSLIDGDHRALIFSQFTSMLEKLEEDLKKRGFEYYKITGATPKAKRMELVKAFNEGTVPLFLISLKAGGTGLNLTGADVVIHYDPWWNTAVQDQATDRAHRIGQTKIVNVYKLIVKGTIEEKIVEMQMSKQKLADDILSGEGVASAALSREDLLELLA
jgi:SNF2 family DNA or RNA helicase